MSSNPNPIKTNTNTNGTECELASFSSESQTPYKPCHFCLSPFKQCVCVTKIDPATYGYPLPPLQPLVLARSNACCPDCKGNCQSCKTNKEAWIEACNIKGFDVCKECLYLVEACECKDELSSSLEKLKLLTFPSPPLMPLVLAKSLACLPDCVGNCNACKENKEAWILQCKTIGYKICEDCFYLVESCTCKQKDNIWCLDMNTPQPPKAGSNIKYDFPHYNNPTNSPTS